MGTTIIRRSGRKLFGMAIISGLLIGYYFLGPYEQTRTIYKSSPIFTIFLGFIFFGLFFYSIIELIRKKGEIILTEEGIEIRNNGWNHWDYVDSFWIVLERDSENPDKEYLVVQLKDMTQIRYMVSDLNQRSRDIIELLRTYKNNDSQKRPQE